MHSSTTCFRFDHFVLGNSRPSSRMRMTCCADATKEGLLPLPARNAAIRIFPILSLIARSEEENLWLPTDGAARREVVDYQKVAGQRSGEQPLQQRTCRKLSQWRCGNAAIIAMSVRRICETVRRRNVRPRRGGQWQKVRSPFATAKSRRPRAPRASPDPASINFRFPPPWK